MEKMLLAVSLIVLSLSIMRCSEALPHEDDSEHRHEIKVSSQITFGTTYMVEPNQETGIAACREPGHVVVAVHYKTNLKSVDRIECAVQEMMNIVCIDGVCQSP